MTSRPLGTKPTTTTSDLPNASVYREQKITPLWVGALYGSDWVFTQGALRRLVEQQSPGLRFVQLNPRASLPQPLTLADVIERDLVLDVVGPHPVNDPTWLVVVGRFARAVVFEHGPRSR